MVIDQCASFPKSKHDDLVDAVTQGLSYLRERGFLHRVEDIAAQIQFEALHQKKQGPIYKV
jgi:hypothetical protein